jgi:aminoglycoside phosphotransferase (APT) family kinase protein
MTKLFNSEDLWVPSGQVSVISRSEVEKCIGPTTEVLQLLSGGQANTNIRIGNDQVLRLYRRDASTAGKELSLIRKNWKTFFVPEVIGSGDGFLWMKYVPHSPLEDQAEVGEALGKVLAEIHSHTYETAGFIDTDLKMEEPMENFVTDMWDYLCSFMDMPSKPSLPISLLDEVIEFFDSKIEGLQEVAGSPVLLHGDFKVSNLHGTDQGKPLVLDWEFAYAGSALMDIGQLFRWPVSPAFEEAFQQAYRVSGGRLADRWKYWAGVLDLINLVGMLYKSTPESQKSLDITAKMKSTLQAG